MRDACLACRRREKDKYWSHCQPVQFCQILSRPFDEQLVIPKKFAENVREKLDETVTLKIPSGIIWNLGLMSDGDTYTLKQGWKAFVEDNFLEENDILIFKYNGNSIFDVNMFDQKNSCEREASHFSTKCKHTKRQIGCKRKSKWPGRIEDEDIESSDNDDDYRPVKSPRRLPTRANAKACRANNKARHRSSNRIGGNPLQLTFHRTAVTGEEAVENAASLVISNMPRRAENKDTDELSNKSSNDDDCIPVKNLGNDPANTPKLSRQPSRSNANARRGKKIGPLKCTSLRRAVTEEEKEKALEKAKANASSSENCFTVVMRPTHVYRRFFLTLPIKWARVNVHSKNQDFVLRTELDTFNAKYHCRGDGGGLIKGWDNFVVHNFLEEFDVCVFHLASRINDGIVLDVSIFRVVEEVIPPKCPLRAKYIEAHILAKLQQVQE